MLVRPNAAIKIVVPPSDSGSETPPPTSSIPANTSPSPRKNGSQRQCRNIQIHGSCKYEGKGCIYSHPPHPNSSMSSSKSINVNAPVFVPKTSTSTPHVSDSIRSTSSTPALEPTSPPFVPHDYNTTFAELSLSNPNITSDTFSSTSRVPPEEDYTGYQDDSEDPVESRNYDQQQDLQMAQLYPARPAYAPQSLSYHLYTEPIPVSHPLSKYFIPDTLREDLQKRSDSVHYLPSSLSVTQHLPEEVSGYHSLVPLEHNPVGGDRKKTIGSWYESVYRAVKSSDGLVYCLRRVENFRLANEHAFAPLDIWKRIRNPNVVVFHEAFTTRAWGDSSLVLVYDYHPTARTLFDTHINPNIFNKPGSAGHPAFSVHPHRPGSTLPFNGRAHPPPRLQHQGVPERVLWTYIIQIASAIKVVHESALAVRTLDPGGSRLLVTGQNRIRVGACGLWDVVTYDPVRASHAHGQTQEMQYLQQEDLLSLGKLLLVLANPTHYSSLNNINMNNQHLSKALDNMGRHYSSEIKNVVLWCMSKPGPHKTIGQLFDMLGPRLLAEMDAYQVRGDTLENALFSELENGRLVRLLVKFGFINERPEFDHEARWSETGDRYIIKLFRDFVFHQVDEEGNPVLDLGHVLTCLNKLDAGSEERIMLVSRDEQSCLVVTFKDIKACIEGAFSDLARAR